MLNGQNNVFNFVFQVCKVSLEIPDSRDPLVNLDSRVLLEPLDNKASLDLWALLDLKDSRDHLDLSDLVVTLGEPVRTYHLAFIFSHFFKETL